MVNFTKSKITITLDESWNIEDYIKTINSLLFVTSHIEKDAIFMDDIYYILELVRMMLPSDDQIKSI